MKEEPEAFPNSQGTSCQVKEMRTDDDDSKFMNSSFKSQTDNLRYIQNPTQKLTRREDAEAALKAQDVVIVLQHFNQHAGHADHQQVHLLDAWLYLLYVLSFFDGTIDQSQKLKEGVTMTRYCSIGALEDKRRKRQNISGRTGGQNEEKTKTEDILQPTCDPHELAVPLIVQNPVDDPASGNAAANDGFAARPRPIRDYLVPILDYLNPAILAPKIQAAHFELKPLMFDMLNSIGKFGGAPHEDARQHIHAFLEVCDCFRQQGVHEDVLKLKLFPYSLHDRARAWWIGLPVGSIGSWANLCKRFLLQHNPPKMHTQLRNDIASFRQADDESMFECWDKYKELLRNCTNHGFHDCTQVMIFYNGVNAPTRMMLDASANGTLLKKSPEEAFDILDRIANNDYQFHSSRLGSGRRTHERLDLDVNYSVSAQLLAITNMLKNLQHPSQVNSSLKALETQVGQIAQALHARPQGSLPSDTEVTKAQGKERCSASTLKEAKFGGETLGEPIHEILYEESRLHDNSPLMERMGKGLMSGPNGERQNIATAKENPQPVGVDEQRVTINVFNTLKYADDFRECQPLQDVESMMAHKEPAEFCCSNFSQIEDYLKLENEDNNEIKEYQREVQHSSIIIARPGMQFEPLYFAEFSFPKPLFEHPPTLELKLLSSYLEHVYLGSNETLPVNNGVHLSRLEIMKELRNELEIKEEFPDEKLLFAAATLWYANIANFLVSGILPFDLNSQGKNKFMHVVPCCHWGDPYLCKECNDRMIRRCVPKEEQKEIIFHCHSASCGKEKIYDRHDMPMQNILKVELLYVWGMLVCTGAHVERDKNVHINSRLRDTPKQVDNGLNVDVPPATMPQKLQHPITNEEAHPTYGAQDKPTTIIVELFKNPHCWSFKLGFLVASREGRQGRTRERDSLDPFKQWSWLMGVTTLTHFRDKDRVSTTKKSRT
ncbi:hypothetical protein GQ457_05G018510 [Hibiscus cannabinus]